MTQAQNARNHDIYMMVQSLRSHRLASSDVVNHSKLESLFQKKQVPHIHAHHHAFAYVAHHDHTHSHKHTKVYTCTCLLYTSPSPRDS